MIFTTSWDDGTVSDLRIAELLERFDFTGTFYPCHASLPRTNERLLTHVEIRSISKKHEIGAHSMTHPYLSRVPEDAARSEVERSRKWVEDVTGKPCTMFCYPFGDHNETVHRIVQSAGLCGARTTEQWQFDCTNPFAFGTSLHIYPFPFRPILNRRCIDPLRNAMPVIRSQRLPLIACRSWYSFATHLFLSASKNHAPFFHLWGHGWEIERYNMWLALERFFAFVRTFEDVTPATNSTFAASLPHAAQ